MRVLLIEDDSATAQTIELMLTAEGFVVFTTDLGEEGAELALQYGYDIVLLDDQLPDMTGLDALRTMRAAKIASPVLMLSNTSDIATKVKAFAAGADDFLAKPFHKDELVARIHAIVRRSKGHAESKVTAGPVVVNIGSKTLSVAGQPVHLTSKEYQMLELLALRKGTTLTKEMFLNHLYGGMDEPDIKIIDVFICKIRHKLRDASEGAELHLETVWGRGYVLRDQPTPRCAKTEAIRRDANAFSTRLLALIAQRPINFPGLRNAFPHVNNPSLSGALSNHKQANRIRFVGLRGSGSYEATEAGKQYLERLAGDLAA